MEAFSIQIQERKFLDRISSSTSGTFRRIGSGVSGNPAPLGGTVPPQKLRTPIQKRKALGALHQSTSQGEVITPAPLSAESVEPSSKDMNAAPASLSDLQPLILTLKSFFRQVHLTVGKAILNIVS